jgi:hypothetical protein
LNLISESLIIGHRYKRLIKMHLQNDGLRRWETVDKYYETRVMKDLFGQMCLHVFHGGQGVRLGNTFVAAVDHNIPKEISKIAKTRLQHGYVEIPAEFIKPLFSRPAVKRASTPSAPMSIIANIAKPLPTDDRICHGPTRKPRKKVAANASRIALAA